jgi:hypothetical protein
MLNSMARSPLLAVTRSKEYVLPAVEVPFVAAFLLLLVGRCASASGSRTLSAFHKSGMEQARDVL